MSEICAGKVERVIGCAGWVVKELDGLSCEASEWHAKMRRQRSDGSIAWHKWHL
jgi:hypothetical protein